MPVLTAPSADLLGSPVSRGALSQIGKRSLSSGSGRRHAWDSRPTGRYRNLGSSFYIWGVQHGTISVLIVVIDASAWPGHTVCVSYE